MSFLRYTGTGIRFNKASYLGLELFGLLLLFVWGYHGNVYGTCIRFGTLPICGFGFEFDHRHRTTTISRRQDGGWWWNSEHLAYRYGVYSDNGWRGPETWVFNHRLLGHHQYL